MMMMTPQCHNVNVDDGNGDIIIIMTLVSDDDDDVVVDDDDDVDDDVDDDDDDDVDDDDDGVNGISSWKVFTPNIVQLFSHFDQSGDQWSVDRCNEFLRFCIDYYYYYYYYYYILEMNWLLY